MSTEIMVVDDEPDTVELVALILESEGYKVISAYGGRGALEILKSAKPDPILLDMKLYSKRGKKRMEVEMNES